MEINILKETKDTLKFEVLGENHTFCNILRKELWNDSHIKAAGYRIEHSLVGSPVIMVQTDGKANPRKVLLSALDRLKKQNKMLTSLFAKLK